MGRFKDESNKGRGLEGTVGQAIQGGESDQGTNKDEIRASARATDGLVPKWARERWISRKFVNS
jgi:hypothetical protein